MNTPRSLLIATSNPAKYDEIVRFLSDIPLEFKSLTDIGLPADAPEDAETFEENAISKAKYYAKRSGLPTIADDGGFEIDALNGAPGVHSHRWIDPTRESSDEELIAHAIEKLAGVVSSDRGAGLRVVIAYANPADGTVHTTTSAVRGVVAEEPSEKRTPGYPYRSLLYLPEIGKFYDHEELTPEQTEEYNHRKRALEELKPKISEDLLTK